MSFIFALMRLSAFILNLLMAVMILAPCRDHKALPAERTRSQQVYAATQDNSQADDDCSPLCTCSCCASISSRVHTLVVAAISSIVSTKKFPVYIAPDYAADRSSVWQPPRIG